MSPKSIIRMRSANAAVADVDIDFFFELDADVDVDASIKFILRFDVYKHMMGCMHRLHQSY